MGIEKIDKNFQLKKTVVINGKKIYQIPSDAFSLYGVSYDLEQERFVRMPLDIAAKVSDGVYALSMHTAGGRLCFCTDSKTLEIAVTYSNQIGRAHV